MSNYDLFNRKIGTSKVLLCRPYLKEEMPFVSPALYNAINMRNFYPFKTYFIMNFPKRLAPILVLFMLSITLAIPKPMTSQLKAKDGELSQNALLFTSEKNSQTKLRVKRCRGRRWTVGSFARSCGIGAAEGAWWGHRMSAFSPYTYQEFVGASALGGAAWGGFTHLATDTRGFQGWNR